MFLFNAWSSFAQTPPSLLLLLLSHAIVHSLWRRRRRRRRCARSAICQSSFPGESSMLTRFRWISCELFFCCLVSVSVGSFNSDSSYLHYWTMSRWCDDLNGMCHAIFSIDVMPLCVRRINVMVMNFLNSPPPPQPHYTHIHSTLTNCYESRYQQPDPFQISGNGHTEKWCLIPNIIYESSSSSREIKSERK